MIRMRTLISGALIALCLNGSAYAQTPSDDGFSMVILSDTQLFRTPSSIEDTPSLNADNAIEMNRFVRNGVNLITELDPWDFTDVGRGNIVEVPEGVIINGDLTENGDMDEAAAFTGIWLAVKDDLACTFIPFTGGGVTYDQESCALNLPIFIWELAGSLDRDCSTFPFACGIPLYLGLGNHDYANNVNDQTFFPSPSFPDSDGAAKESVFRLGRMITALYLRTCITADHIPYDIFKVELFNNCTYPYFPLGDGIFFDPDGDWGPYGAGTAGDEPSFSLAYSWDINNYHFVQLNNFPSYEVLLENDSPDGCESRMAVMSAAWFVEFRQRLPWLLHVD